MISKHVSKFDFSDVYALLEYNGSLVSVKSKVIAHFDESMRSRIILIFTYNAYVSTKTYWLSNQICQWVEAHEVNTYCEMTF